MSVLSFPRIYFKGFMEWDPCTFNNNDWQAFPTYDAANAELNWSFLATQSTPVAPGVITPDNFGSSFRPWGITLQPDAVDAPAGARIPAEWNMFGTHGVSFVQYQNLTSTIVGGDLGFNQPATGDALIGRRVKINGDGGHGAGRLVDTNPISPWSSQIYFGELAFGDDATIIKGSRAYRMHSRWLNRYRIYSTDSSLTAPASSIAACFQTGIPNSQLTWPSDPSPLAKALQTAAEQPGALGIMVRFTAYVNLYFVNGIFNKNTQQQPRTYEDLAGLLATAWNAWNTNGDPSQFFSNPCYSHVVGAVGVWNEGELASVPGGRCLAAGAAVSPLSVTATAQKTPRSEHSAVPRGHAQAAVIAGPGQPVPLGPVAASVDFESQLISLDLSSTIPENGTPGQWPSDLVKADFGALDVGVMNNGTFTSIASIEYDQYQQSAYEARAGIVDIQIPNPGAAALLKSGTLSIQVQSQTALVEQVLAAQTDTRGIYLDQSGPTGQTEFQVTLFESGAPAAGANLMIAIYDAGLSLVPAGQPQFVNFTTGQPISITVPNAPNPTITASVQMFQADQNGNVAVGVSAQSPGFPVLAFFPFTDVHLPQPPASFNFLEDAYYTTVRVLPFNDALPQTFVDLWNGAPNEGAAWNFIYKNVLSLYDMLFNVMLKSVNLGDRQAVEESLSGIWSRISADAAQESTGAMPITRDMSAGKRLTLQLWIYLAANKYNVPSLNVNSIPSGWFPPS